MLTLRVFVTDFAIEVDNTTENTQSERRLLSPVLKNIPWTTDVMQVLQQLDPTQRNGVCFYLVSLLYLQKY
jgi:hypothetical protein